MKGLGLLTLVVGAVVSFLGYNLISQVLEEAELQSHRLLRFRDLGGWAFGRKWGYYPVAVVQILLCMGTVIACVILGGQSMKLIYNVFHTTGSMQLYEFTIIFGVVMMALSQLPSFHSLRYINLASLLCSLAYSLCAVAGCIYAGHSGKALATNHNVVGSPVSKMFGVFNSLIIIATLMAMALSPRFSDREDVQRLAHLLRRIGSHVFQCGHCWILGLQQRSRRQHLHQSATISTQVAQFLVQFLCACATLGRGFGVCTTDI